MKQKLIRFSIDNVLLPMLGMAMCLALWCVISYVTYDPATEASDFPTPLQVWNESYKYIAQPFTSNSDEGYDGLGLETWRSLQLVGAGYLMSLVVAVPIGFLLGGSRVFARCFDPVFQILRPVSPLAWFPLAGLLVMTIRRQNDSVDATQLQCIFTIAICSIWPTILNTAVGVRAIPQDYINVAKVLRLSAWGRFVKVLLPATLPYMFTGFRLSLGIAWLVIVAAEMLSGKSGIGAFVNNQYQSNTPAPMIMAILIIGLTGFVLDRIMNVVEKNVHVILGAPRYVRAALHWMLASRAGMTGKLPVPATAQEAGHVAP